MNSAAYSGLPPQRSTTRSATAGGSSAPARSATSRALPVWDSGDSAIRVAGRGQHQQRHVAAPAEQMLQELQQRLVGPVQVLDDEDERITRRDGLQETSPGGEILLLTGGLHLLFQPDQRGEPLHHPRLVLGRHRGVGDGLCQPQPGLAGRVVIEQADVGLHHLTQRPERQPLPVGQAPALPPRHQLRQRVHPGAELRDQPGLADPRLAADRHQLHAAVPHRPAVDAAQQIQLVLPAHMDHVGPWVGLHPEPAPRPDGPPQRHRRGFPFHRHRRQLLVLHHRAGRPPRDLPHHHSVGRGGRLQPGGGIDHIPGHHRLTTLRPGADGHHRLAGVYRRPRRQALFGDQVDHPQRRPHRPLRIILMSYRRPEHGHHRIPDELLHRPAVPLQLVADQLVVRLQHLLHVLRVCRLRESRRPHQIDKENRNDLAFGGQYPGWGKRRPTLGAKPAGRHLHTARHAHNHGQTLTTRAREGVRRTHYAGSRV